MGIKVAALVQARLASTRLPSKVLKKINDRYIIEILLSRLSQSKKVNEIFVLTTENHEDKKLIDVVKKLGFRYFCGSEDDVLNRYYEASKKFNIESIVRITGDCPLIDPAIVDNIIDLYFEKNVDYASNTL